MNDDDLSVEELVNEKSLPDREWDENWTRIYVDKQDKEKLVNYGLLLQQFDKQNLDNMTLSHHGVVLLTGPPGTGKTSLAKGAANELAKRTDKEVVFKQIEVQHLFSGSLGDTPKLVENAFQQVIEPARNPENDTYQVLLLDEVESLFSSRSMLSGDTDPMDAVRAVNTALEAIDELSELPGVYLIATSNQPRAVDSAYYDRTDDQIFLGNPEPVHRGKILLDVFSELNDTVGTKLPTEQSEIQDAIQKTDGFSGRRIRKTVLAAISRNEATVNDPKKLSYEQVLEEIERTYALIRQKGSSDYINLGESPDEALPAEREQQTGGSDLDSSIDSPQSSPPSEDISTGRSPAENDRPSGSAESEETGRPDEAATGPTNVERTAPPEEQSSERSTEESVEDEPTSSHEQEQLETGRFAEAANVRHEAAEDEPEETTVAEDSNRSDSGEEQSDDEWLEPRIAVFDTTAMNSGKKLCTSIASYFVDTLERGGYDQADAIQETLTSDGTIDVVEELCLRRNLDGISVTADGFKTSVEVATDKTETKDLVVPSEGAVPTLPENASVTIAIQTDADVELPSSTSDDIEITIGGS